MTWSNDLNQDRTFGNEPNNNGGNQHYGVYNFNTVSLWDDQSLAQVINRKWILERSDDYILGCNDPYAENYDEDVTHDDGSCSGYPENGEYSLAFDGVDDYVEISNADIFSDFNEMSINLYLKIADHEICSIHQLIKFLILWLYLFYQMHDQSNRSVFL